jgi:hypothetical protein
MTDTQETILREVHEAVCGNPATGNPGILKNMEIVERKLRFHDRIIYTVSGVLLCASALWEIIKFIHT